MHYRFPGDAGNPLLRGADGEPVLVPAFEEMDGRNQLRHCFYRHGFRYGVKAAKAIEAGELDLSAMHKKSHAESRELDHEHG